MLGLVLYLPSNALEHPSLVKRGALIRLNIRSVYHKTGQDPNESRKELRKNLTPAEAFFEAY